MGCGAVEGDAGGWGVLMGCVRFRGCYVFGGLQGSGPWDGAGVTGFTAA